jgi:hypothetical protein
VFAAPRLIAPASKRNEDKIRDENIVETDTGEVW